MRRTLLAAVASLALALPASAQDGGRMTLQAYAGIFRDNYTQTVVAPFTAARGTAVQYFDGGTSAQMLGALRAQRADPQIDVVIMDVTTAAIACAEGLVEKIDASTLPVIADVDEQGRQAGGECGPAVTYDHLVMVYDSRAVTPAPTSLAAMWAPEHRGRVALSAPPNIQGLALTAILAHANGGNWRNLNAAMPRLRELAPSVQTFDPNPDGYTLILNDQVRFATGWNARAQLYSDQSQGRIGVTLPQEGTVFQINTINLVANAKNRAQGLAFMAHALSPEAQAAFTERMFYGPTNSRAQVSAAALSRTALAPEFRSRVIPLDWSEMVRLRDSWNQRWRREVIAAASR
ncbi:ABC transporter substrate-binding protein [Falsiroseomonas tokyonensis]|uniref:ABC transporter substrate-binding protein n=1 Tax=Falsiroseomonas tokyonensis TaxID=430521 RepID=A0ABV7C0P5_9PROT|nr:ABC transporter substrate-binding protein [Falsiroseomonas tokyonensis]MBU8540482.1 ABC transporter substrate-binding protein [Falsiroseomonas tokyonensis]